MSEQSSEEAQGDVIRQLRTLAAEIRAKGRHVDYLLYDAFVSDAQLAKRLIWRARSTHPVVDTKALRTSPFSIEAFEPEKLLSDLGSKWKFRDVIVAGVSAAVIVLLVLMLVSETVVITPLALLLDAYGLAALQGLSAALVVLNAIMFLRRIGTPAETLKMRWHVEECARFTETLYEVSLHLED